LEWEGILYGGTKAMDYVKVGALFGQGIFTIYNGMGPSFQHQYHRVFLSMYRIIPLAHYYVITYLHF